MKELPYNIDNFERVIRDDYYFVDKSFYIKRVEDRSSFVLLTRPRRMGKSLFTNMMMSYYDIKKAGQFQELFGTLWIGKNPTKWANKFLVMKLDFSKVKCDFDDLERNFDQYCLETIETFLTYYNEYYNDSERERILAQPLAKDAVNKLIGYSSIKGLRLYLFIDEYDNFTNMVLTSRGVNAHREITHGQGFYRDFFKSLKGSYDRIFMTGVAPVSYDDLSSGFSIADVVTLHAPFNHAIGVTEEELRQMIEYYRAEGAVVRAADDIIAEIKPWYDNFCFSEACYGKEDPIYNTSMVISYLRHLLDCGCGPKSMVDHSARVDSNKLDYLVMTDDLGDRRKRLGIVEGIASRGFTTGEVEVQFPASDAGMERNFKSMLFYLGTLTFGGVDDCGVPILKVPNKTMADLYLNYMLTSAERMGVDIDREEFDRAVRRGAVEGDWRAMAAAIGEAYSRFTSVRNAAMGEADADGFIRGLLCLSPFYDVWPEAELSKGYGDILLVPRSAGACPTRHSYVLELKHMKASEADPAPKVEEARAQLARYAADPRLASSPVLRGTDLTPLYLVFRQGSLVASGTL